MDIVHLIETQMNKSVQEQTSRTYAEIEKTLDHSEGSNANKHSFKHTLVSATSGFVVLFSFVFCVSTCFGFSVSVALSSVQEDTDSPRVMRRVESDQRQPPAVSEEDLSVASLLDIPSWAEPVGQSNLESIHSDLLEELEIPQYIIYFKLFPKYNYINNNIIFLLCMYILFKTMF